MVEQPAPQPGLKEKHMQVKFIGASDSQVRWGSCADPRVVLAEGATYEVEREEVHSWHTKLFLVGFPGLGFNDVCFERPDRP